MKSLTVVLIASCALYGASTAGASARQHFGARFFDPGERDVYAVSQPAGFVFMRHSYRCAYPQGWSSGDFSRNLNGIPRGGHELLATGCGVYEPLTD